MASHAVAPPPVDDPLLRAREPKRPWLGKRQQEIVASLSRPGVFLRRYAQGGRVFAWLRVEGTQGPASPLIPKARVEGLVKKGVLVRTEDETPRTPEDPNGRFVLSSEYRAPTVHPNPVGSE